MEDSKRRSGAAVQRGSVVRVEYKGMLTDGRTFDASALHGKPLELQAGVGQVIPGWDLTLLDMKKGERRIVAIPPELAYGSAGGGAGSFRERVLGVRDGDRGRKVVSLRSSEAKNTRTFL
jgi:FKBP-type peptidyl-prolyl cis-trans isomerase